MTMSVSDKLINSEQSEAPTITITSNNTNIGSRHHARSTSTSSSSGRQVKLRKDILKLGIFSVVIVALLAALLWYSVNFWLKQSSSDDDWTIKRKSGNVCKTVDCYKATNYIMDYLNQSVSPCDNFYQFACGSWIDRNSVEEEQDQERDHFSLAYEKMLQDISDVLKEPIDGNSNDTPIVKDFKRFYASCTAKDKIEYDTDRYFLDYMSAEFSEWPLLNAKSQKGRKIELEEHLAKLTTLRMPLLFRFESDDFNHSQILFKILVPEDFCLLQKFLPTNSSSKAYFFFFNLVNSIQKSMWEGVNRYSSIEERPPQVDDQIVQMLKLAQKLYFLDNSRYKCGQPKTANQSSYNQKLNVLTIEQLQNQVIGRRKSSLFDFGKYIYYLNKHVGGQSANKLKLSTSVIISNLALNYLHDLFEGLNERLLADGDENLQRAFLNFIYFHNLFSLIKPLDLFKPTPTLWQIVHVNVLLPIKYYHMFFEYSKLVNNVTLLDNLINIFKLSREHNCAYSVIETFSVVDTHEQIELQRLFISRKLQPGTKKLADEMLNHLITTSNKILARQDWIDNKTKLAIRSTMDQIEYKIVYTDALFDDSRLTSRVTKKQEYNISESYLLNVFNLRRAFFKKDFDLLGISQAERIRNRAYVFDIFLANLMYLKEFNTLIMPAGMASEPIFNTNHPAYLNFATIGTYMSHEIWHAVHEELLESTDEHTQSQYVQRLNCLVNNYNQYTKSKYGLSIDGEISSSEQIADTFGILASFHTFVQMLNNRTEHTNHEHRASLNFNFLPGLDYDQQQLFFIRYAQSYCRKSKLYSLYDFHQYHVINEFRAFQISLIPEFFPVFKCDMRKEDKSNTMKPCQIFDF